MWSIGDWISIYINMCCVPAALTTFPRMPLESRCLLAAFSGELLIIVGAGSSGGCVVGARKSSSTLEKLAAPFSLNTDVGCLQCILVDWGLLPVQELCFCSGFVERQSWGADAKTRQLLMFLKKSATKLKCSRTVMCRCVKCLCWE